jgi:hypothetical protein
MVLDNNLRLAYCMDVMKKNPTTNETKTTTTLPAHLVAALAKYEAKNKQAGFTMTDVTPKGYGPKMV